MRRILCLNLGTSGGLIGEVGTVTGALALKSTAAETAAYVAGQTAKIGLSMGGFYASVNFVSMGYNQLSASGISAASTNKQTMPSQLTQSQSLQQGATTASNQYNYTPTDYINGEVSSFAQGFTFGTEYAGTTATYLTTGKPPSLSAAVSYAVGGAASGGLLGEVGIATARAHIDVYCRSDRSLRSRADS
jgi:hypothetical protein